MRAPKSRAVFLSILAGGGICAGLYRAGLLNAPLNAIGIDTRSVDAQRLALFGAPQPVDWPDLINLEDSGTGPRLRDGRLPRGIVGHGEIQMSPQQGGQNASSDSVQNYVTPLAERLGGFGNLDAPPRRLADSVGGIGNLRALQPKGGRFRADLDGKTIRIAGFIAPLEFDGSRISAFLLVPYVGACIHVPPPPANQIIYVTDLGNYRPDQGLLFPIWVTGRLQVSPQETELAAVGYQMAGAVVERYE